MDFEKIYICVRSGFNKKGEPYSQFCHIKKDERENKYQYIDSKDSIYVQYIEDVATIKVMSGTLA